MFKLYFLFGFLLLSISTTAQPYPLDATVDQIIKPYFEQRDFYGSVLLVVGGAIQAQKNYGWLSARQQEMLGPDTPFMIGSISKQFTATAILKLEEMGELRTEDLLSDYISGFPEGIQLHHLLTHSSGLFNTNLLPGYDKWMKKPTSIQQALEEVKSKPLGFEPGTRYAYSNTNYLLLAQLIEQLSGKKYGDFLQQHLFEPAGLQNTGTSHERLLQNSATGLEHSPSGKVKPTKYKHLMVKKGAGSLYSTVNDLYRWHQYLLSDNSLSENSKAKLYTPFLNNYAYGWDILEAAGTTISAHDGRVPGFSTQFARGIKADICLVILSNMDSGAVDEITEAIQAALEGKQLESPKTKTYRLEKKRPSKAYLGKYKMGAEFFEIIRVKKGLFLRWDHQERLHYLKPLQEEDHFLLHRNFVPIHFERDESKQIKGLKINQTSCPKLE